MSLTDAEWRPINENHAIEVMGVAITFAQPLPGRILNRIFQAIEEAAFASGLRSRHFVQGMQIELPLAGGGAPTFTDAPVAGRIYNAVRQAEDGNPAEGISEQLQIDGNSIVYRNWNYVSWNWVLQRLTTLTRPALDIGMDVVNVKKIRLEYLDRFFFAGDASSAEVAAALKPFSPLVAPHIYSQKGQCHSHTGAFRPAPNGARWLMQVNLDFVDRADPSQRENIRRWLNITTALEHQFNDEDCLNTAADIFSSVDVLHEPLKDVLAEIISGRLAGRISLGE